MIATDWNNPGRDGKLGGVTYYRLQMPKKYLEQMGYKVDLYGKDFGDNFEGLEGQELMEKYREFVSQYDVVISKVVDNQMAAAALIGSCQATETPLVVDIDDNFLEVLNTQPAFDLGYDKGGDARATAGAFVSRADALFCSTQPLAKYFQQWIQTNWGEDKPAYILPNCAEPSTWYKAKQGGDVIGWQGSITHNQDLKAIVPDLVKIAEKYPKVEFEFLGGFNSDSAVEVFKEAPDWFFKRLRFVSGTLGFEGFPELMGERNWLLGICPLVDCEFNRSKSHIKWLEYSLIGFPTVASRVYPYCEQIQGTQTIVDGNTGLLADDWFETLDWCLQNKQKLKTIKKNAGEFVENNWHYKDHIYKWDEAIQNVIS